MARSGEAYAGLFYGMDPQQGSLSYTEVETYQRTPSGETARAERTAWDRTLIQRMAAGDQNALGDLYDHWRTVVFAVVFRIVGDAEDAEELLEDTFWQAWRQAPKYQPDRGSVATWLLTIARSRALDRARAEGRRSVAQPADGQSAPWANERISEPASMGAERREEARIVRAAVFELPVEQRETLELAYFGGLSQTEIADRLTLPLGTVKTRLRLALRKLRDRLSVLREGEL